MKKRICFVIFLIFVSGILFSSQIPELKIEDYNANLPNVQNMFQLNDNEWTGRFCVKAVIKSSGDYVPDGDPFIWTVRSGNDIIAAGANVLIMGEWINSFKVKDPEKYETGTKFSPDNIDGSAIKIGGRFRNLGVFEMTLEVKKTFLDDYYGVWSITYKGIKHRDSKWGEILERSETILIEHNFTEDEPDPEPECTGNITITCENGNVITTHKCVDGKLVETGEKCPDPQPEPEPEENKKSLLVRIIQAIINFFVSIFS